MKERSLLDPSNPEFMPLYRPKNFKQEERIKVKYVNRYNWYTDIDLKDPFRNKWKNRVKRKGDKMVRLHSPRSGG